MSQVCPKCGFRTRITSQGDWIKNKEQYTAFWADKPVEVKLAIESYFFFNGRIPETSLDFTAKHEGADWPLVKKVYQELRRSGLVYDSFL